ncbi:hypothetical protein Egran_00177 [Elaphomyces granulatus]|uniref:Zn(2)-C6 fungal-type domain-containing protein n=1 Tax=Elaphomyces granulatus TaxID=519963 RepID=A0A232M6M9_9EURO|nr:hypothetical protein Egran_00177 [Elaphomyces granulatus]
MSSSLFLEKPVLKVSRPVAACSRCRTAKIKCDGKLPACSACERAGKVGTCSGATDEFAKGKERSYVASLEGYCERLERKLRDIRHNKQALTAAGLSTIEQSSITSISVEGTGVQGHHKEISDIDDLVGDFGFLSVNATSRDFRGITSRVSFARVLLTLSSREPLPQYAPTTSTTLPPRYEATCLFQHYFDYIFPQLPFFIETSFWTSVDAVYQDDGRFAKAFDHWIVRMVLAISSSSLSLRRGDNSSLNAMSLVSAALYHIEDVLRPGAIAGIQAILLLAQYSLIDPEHFRVWYLVGLAAKAMIDLGLHQDTPVELYLNDHRLNLRRRVFHCLYALDRFVSTASGRAFSFSDDSVNVGLPNIPQLPTGLSGSQRNNGFLQSLEPALHLFKIRQILSAGYQEMHYSGRQPSPQPLVLTWTLCAKARDWFDKAPKDAPHYFTIRYRLELIYTTIVFLSPSHRDPAICDFSKILLFDHCIDYVSQLHQVLPNPNNLNYLPFMTYVDIQRVHQVGRRFLEVLSQNHDLLLGSSVPEPPLVPPDTPEPPYIAVEDHINCLARAINCLSYIRDILYYCAKRWNMRDPLDEFVRDSAALRQRLIQLQENYRVTYRGLTSSSFVPTTAMALPVVNGYQVFDVRYIGSRNPY